MDELLKLCGYEELEDKEDIQRAKRAFHKLGVTDEDVERAKRNIRKYYDVELEGIRKMLGIYLRDGVNLVLAREDGRTNIVYAIMAEGFDLIASAFTSKSEEVYVSWPESTFEILFGPTFFDKQHEVLEAAEARWLKEGIVSHCANVKMLAGLVALDLIPRPDLLIVSGFLCDVAPKTVDLMHEFYDVPMYYFGTCLDREEDEGPEAEKERVALAANQMEELVKNMVEVIGIEVTEEDLWKQIEAKKDLKNNMAQIHGLLDNSKKPLISATHGSVIFLLQRLAANWSNVPRLIDTTSIIYNELKERYDKGYGVVEEDAPLILALNPVSFTDPRLEYMIEQLGMAVTTEIDLFFPDGRRAPEVEETDNVYVKLCAFLQDSKTRKLADRFNIFKESAKKLKVDGILCRGHVGCRTIYGDIMVMKDALGKELGVPTMLLEVESFDPRFYNHEVFKRRMEMFKMMIESQG